MPGDLFGNLGRMWQDVRKKTNDAVQQGEASMARGKVAGVRVLDDDGRVVVDAGHVIDDAALERAAAAGKMHEVASSVLKAHVQDAREKIAEQTARTPDGQESAALSDVEDYADARRYVGRHAGIDVTDIRGTVIVPEGKEITEDDVRAARGAGQLAALIYAAQQPADPQKVAEQSAVSRPTNPYLGAQNPENHRPARPLVPEDEWTDRNG